MDTKQVKDGLEGLFREEDERIVFWNNPDREFAVCSSEQLFSPAEGESHAKPKSRES